MFLIYLLLCFATCGRSSETDEKCFTSVICTIGSDGNQIPSWIPIAPSPNCSGKGDDYGYLEMEYTTSRENFIRDLDDNSSDALTTQSGGTMRCFMPTVCSTATGSQTNWLMTYKNSCEDGVTDEKSLEIYNRYNRLALNDIEERVNSTCPSCLKTLNELKSIFRTANASATEDPKDCYAPAICSKGEEATENWIKVYPPKNCTSREAKVTTSEVITTKENFDMVLQQAIKTFRAINKNGRCSEC